MSEYDEIGWSDELNRVAASVQPTPEAGPLVRAGIRRRQRRRAAMTVTASVAAVAGVVGTTFALARPSHESGPVPLAEQPSTSTPSTRSGAGPAPYLQDWLWEEPKPGDCPDLSKVFDPDAAPPIPDLDRQQQIVEAIGGQVRDAYRVRFTQATPLGVVALVIGNIDIAKEQLGEAGVPLVYEWDRSGPEVGLDEEGQVGQVLAWQLDPVVNDVRRRIHGVSADGGPGEADLALWLNAGAVLLQWKEPVPAAVLALQDVDYPHGVRVVVEGVRYSPSELHRAMGEVMDRARAAGIEANSGSGCGDDSGIVIGVGPDDLRGHEAELKEQLTEWAGMPVTVKEAEPAVLLSGTVGSRGPLPR